jgi:hypothetical protein
VPPAKHARPRSREPIIACYRAFCLTNRHSPPRPLCTVQANSIEGCKKASVVVVYTPWANLKKDGGMEVSAGAR